MQVQNWKSSWIKLKNPPSWRIISSHIPTGVNRILEISEMVNCLVKATFQCTLKYCQDQFWSISCGFVCNPRSSERYLVKYNIRRNSWNRNIKSAIFDTARFWWNVRKRRPRLPWKNRILPALCPGSAVYFLAASKVNGAAFLAILKRPVSNTSC